MHHKFSLIAFLVFVVLQGGDCLGLCRPKIGLPISVPPLALQMPMSLGVACADPVSNCGPEPLPLPIIQAPPVTVPTIEGPIIPLPSPPIPCPRTIAHKCVCTKTVVKPQLIQRCITVPSVQRYLKRTYTPVVENIAYKAKPRCPCGGACGGRGVSACTCGARGLPACSCGARLAPPAVCACGAPKVCAPPPLALPYSRIC